MVDVVLFELLHKEMVAELWEHEPDPDPGPGVSAGPRGGSGSAGRGGKVG